MCSLLVPPEDLRVRRQADKHINVRVGWKQYSLSHFRMNSRLASNQKQCYVRVQDDCHPVKTLDPEGKERVRIFVTAACAEYGGARG